MIKIWLASDHAGIELKKKIYFHLSTLSVEKHYDLHDLGPSEPESVDYPDYADAVCKKLHAWSVIDLNKPEKSHLAEMGILICGSGQGMAMRANRYPSVRAALCYDLNSTKLSREHNDANIICLGARTLTVEQALELVDTFLATPFAGGRHQGRVAKLCAPIGG